MFLCGFCCFAVPVAAQAQPDNNQQEVQINLSDKADLNLSALVQFLANTKKMKITANSSKFPGTVQNKVIFYGDFKVSEDSFLEVVQSILRTNGFALVKSDVGDLYQIVERANVRPFAPLVPDGKIGEFPAGEYVTGVFPLEKVNAQQAITFIEQMVYGVSSNSGNDTRSNITILPNRNTLIITETADRLTRIETLLKRIDVPGELLVREFYKVKHLQAQELQQQLTEILNVGGQSNAATAQPKCPEHGEFAKPTNRPD